MEFEELARKAGTAATSVGRGAERPPLASVLPGYRRRTLLMRSWAAVAAITVIVTGILVLWPDDEREPTPVATGLSTPTTTSGIDACPLTLPGIDSFTPAEETPQMSPPDPRAVWFGTPRLWTSVHPDGEIWSSLPVAPDGTLTQKTFWWSEDIVSVTDPVPDISFTAERLDELGSPVLARGVTSGGNPEQGVFVIAGFQIPEVGCWRITAEYGDSTVSYVAWVQGQDPSTQTFALLDGSGVEIRGAPVLDPAGYLFTLDVEGVGPSNVDLSPGLDPADPLIVDETAVLEADLGDGVRLWRADREGEPLYLTVDLGAWVAVLNVGYEVAPSYEDLLAIADQLDGASGARGVILSNYTPDVFTTYLKDPIGENQIQLLMNRCLMEMVSGAELVDDARVGELIRGNGYASWCEQEANIEVRVHGDEAFVDRIVSELTISRTAGESSS